MAVWVRCVLRGGWQEVSLAVHMTRRTGWRLVAAAAAIGTSIGVIVVSPELAAGAPAPPKPVPVVTAAQVQAAYNNKAKLASYVGQLSAAVAQAQINLSQAQGRQEMAEQKVALAISNLQIAEQQAKAAQHAVQVAQQHVSTAHAQFVQYLQATYMSGDVSGTGGALLTASDPSQLLEQSTLEQYQAQHQATAIGELQAATVARSNAQAAAKRAVLKTQQLKAAAVTAEQQAAVATAQARTAEAQAEQSRNQAQATLNAAQLQLATLNNQRAQYLSYLSAKAKYEAYQAEQRRLAAERAAAAAARARARHHHHGGGSSGGGGGGWSAPPSGGSWTPAKGRAAVRRAETQLNVPYAWAGGNQYGPTYGVCSPANGAPNDCNVDGFDCSGLAMYAWGQGWAHFAATQYWQAGSYHPSLNNLMPGDLLFWSYGGAADIHHVAIYIGGGQIIQAPESGSYVMISSMYDPGPIYGATRPLT